jgi:hypothetical protein
VRMILIPARIANASHSRACLRLILILALLPYLAPLAGFRRTSGSPPDSTDQTQPNFCVLRAPGQIPLAKMYCVISTHLKYFAKGVDILKITQLHCVNFLINGFTMSTAQKTKRTTAQPVTPVEQITIESITLTASRSNRIANLEIGETEAIVTRLDFDTTTKEVITDTINRNKSTMSGAVGRAKRIRPGTQFSVEVGDMFTRNGDILIVVAATRTE